MNVLSLFDGISCGQLALQRANIPVENYFASEIDKYAIQVTQKNFPNTIQLGDVTRVDMDDLPPIDLLIGGSPCFTAQTKIITKVGYKNIEDIRINDYVLTHNNRFRRVLQIGHNYHSKTFTLKAQGIFDTFVTGNHPYYIRTMTRKWDKEHKIFKRVFSSPIWKPVAEITKGDFIGIPIPTAENNPYNLTNEYCWLLGRYLADGHIRKSKRKGRKNSYHYGVYYSIGSKKLTQFLDAIKTVHITHYIHTQSTYRCVINSKEMVNFILSQDFGRGASNKKIPPFVFELPVSLAKSFLDGYMSGDGCFTNNTFKATSTSKELIMGLQLLIAKIYHTSANVEHTKRDKTYVIEGRTVNQKDTYSISFNIVPKKQNHTIKIDNHIWYPVKQVIQNTDETVYNLEIHEDNSYTANNAVVHNCQGFSFAGKQLNFSDPRSKLFFEFVRLLNQLNPKYFLLENVIMKQEYQDIISKYIGVQPIKIDSALFSAQQRKRLYWTNIPIQELPDSKESPNLQDILQSEVDEKYWVKPKRPIIQLPEGKRKWGYIGSDAQANRIYNINGKSVTLTGLGGGLGAKMGIYYMNPATTKEQRLNKATIVGRRLNEKGHRQDYNSAIPITQCLEVRQTNTDKSNCLTTVAKDNVVTPLPYGRYPDAFSGNYPFRMLTPIECERLQTLPDNYTQGISDNQRYKCLGNGWTVDVIAHILKGIVYEKEKTYSC